MKCKFFLILFTILTLSSCSVKGQEIKIIEGVIEFSFVKDTVGIGKYWLKEKKILSNGKPTFVIGDISDVAPSISLVCNKNLTLENDKERTSIYELPQYESQSELEEDFYKHVGGDIYQKEDSSLVIIFKIKVEGYLFKSPPCDEFNFDSNYSCPVRKPEVFFPILVASDVLSSKSLTLDESQKLNLSKYKPGYFSRGVCD